MWIEQQKIIPNIRSSTTSASNTLSVPDDRTRKQLVSSSMPSMKNKVKTMDFDGVPEPNSPLASSFEMNEVNQRLIKRTMINADTVD